MAKGLVDFTPKEISKFKKKQALELVRKINLSDVTRFTTKNLQEMDGIDSSAIISAGRRRRNADLDF